MSPGQVRPDRRRHDRLRPRPSHLSLKFKSFFIFYFFFFLCICFCCFLHPFLVTLACCTRLNVVAGLTSGPEQRTTLSYTFSEGNKCYFGYSSSVNKTFPGPPTDPSLVKRQFDAHCWSQPRWSVDKRLQALGNHHTHGFDCGSVSTKCEEVTSSDHSCYEAGSNVAVSLYGVEILCKDPTFSNPKTIRTQSLMLCRNQFPLLCRSWKQISSFWVCTIYAGLPRTILLSGIPASTTLDSFAFGGPRVRSVVGESLDLWGTGWSTIVQIPSVIIRPSAPLFWYAVRTCVLQQVHIHDSWLEHQDISCVA